MTRTVLITGTEGSTGKTALALALAACSEPERSPTPRGATTVFSPAAVPAPPSTEADVGGTQAVLAPDPAALDEILAAAPRASGWTWSCAKPAPAWFCRWR